MHYFLQRSKSDNHKENSAQTKGGRREREGQESRGERRQLKRGLGREGDERLSLKRQGKHRIREKIRVHKDRKELPEEKRETGTEDLTHRLLEKQEGRIRTSKSKNPVTK